MKRRSFVAALLAGVGLGRLVQPPAPAVEPLRVLLPVGVAGDDYVFAATYPQWSATINGLNRPFSEEMMREIIAEIERSQRVDSPLLELFDAK